MKTKPFNLEEYLINPSQKVVTRNGRDVRIIFTEAKDDKYPIVALVKRETEPEKERPHLFSISGVSELGRESILDLFFLDESEELTEFEKAVENIINYPHFQDIQSVKQFSKTLLDLARKQFQPEIDKEIELAYNTRDEVVYCEGYDKGKEDAQKIPSNPDYETLKNELGSYLEDVVNGDFVKEESLNYWTDRFFKIAEDIALSDMPRWKKFGAGIAGNCDREVFLIRNDDGTYYTSKVLSSDCVYLELRELEKLPM